MSALVQAQSLSECEQIIARGLETFTEVAAALIQIRDNRLYLQSHDTFEDYCRGRWQMSARRAYQIISSKNVADRIAEAGLPIPANDAVARALAVLPEREQVKIWDAAVKYFNGRVTAAALKDFLPHADDLGPLTRAGYSAQCPKCSNRFIPIFAEKASRGPKTPSRGVRWALERIPQGGSAVDYGCGRFRNTKLIAGHFHHTLAVDTFEQVQRIRPHNPGGIEIMDTEAFKKAGTFNTIFLVAVLHIVPLAKREEIAKALERRSEWLLVEVPTQDAHYRKLRAEPFEDGFIMTGNTFYAPLNREKVVNLFPEWEIADELPDKSAVIILFKKS